MKVLIVGNGGREHAIAWKIAQSPMVERVFVAPGNGGTHFENKCSNLPIKDKDEMLKFALKEGIDLTIVGPEAYLVEGIVDDFKRNNLKIFGPSKDAAMLEGSKIFAKNFMKKYGVKTAEYQVFEDIDEAKKYIKDCPYPCVIKADGLAAGKGVVIAENYDTAFETLNDFMINDVFKGSGKKIVIEEFLEGVEASILAITDGEAMIPFLSAKDHKTIFEDNKGPNTGGMGAICPNPFCTEEVLTEFDRDILLPTLEGFMEENMDYTGIVFFGLMITKKGTYLLEYNVRMGDPETQAVLPMMESDLTELILAALDGRLKDYDIKWKKGACCSVVLASKGYPGEYKTGYEIKIGNIDGKVFAAGAKEKDGKLLTSGGRVLCVSALGSNLNESIEMAYKGIKGVNFNDMYYRKDIGKI